MEINGAAAEAGRSLNPQAQILCGDILDLSSTTLRDKRFDVVFSLGCIDWNVQFADMLAAAWGHVVPGGHLVSTFRLTPGAGCDDFDRSYQYINFDGLREGERASYVVSSASDLMRTLGRLEPAGINAYGYWGAPSASAVTPYETLCFAAFSVRKRQPGETADPTCRLDLPAEILDAMEQQPQLSRR